MQALIFGQDKYFWNYSTIKICQTGYKPEECTKTNSLNLVILLKEISEKQDL